MAAIKGKVRSSQIVTTYGIGAITALEDESFMIAGIDRWGSHQPDLYEPRLERELGVHGFVSPPTSENRGDIPVVRFPRWHSCPKCKRLADHRFFTSFDQNVCNTCNRVLIPSRFVVACRRGHIDDFPYHRWVHGPGTPAEGHDLFIEAGGTTSALRDIVVRCSCGRSRTMEGAFDKFALRDLGTCRGRRPWLGGNEECSEFTRALQRGGSNVWFGKQRSAISIPPWSDGAFKLLNKFWFVLESLSTDAIRDFLSAKRVGDGTAYSIDDLIQAVEQRRGTAAAVDAVSGDLRLQEYEALEHGKPEESKDQQFVATPGEVPAELQPYLDLVMLVPRLREVRALEGFTRILPSTDDESIAPIFVTDPGWRPAIEVKGEGIFLRIDETRLAEWEQRPAVRRRADRINARQQAVLERNHRPPEPPIRPRDILLHTLAHLLIDQFALDCGYPSAALRERLYTGDAMRGVLIYTATTDSAGSLGGLVSQARPDRLLDAMAGLLERSRWCSSDPVCIESSGQGVDALNLAACHACCLLPETSCERMNVFLDRAMVTGTVDEPELGFFDGVVG
jgi:hypothetical protein